MKPAAAVADGVAARQMGPMLERVAANCGEFPKIMTADSGYISEANITYCAARGVDA